MQGPDLNNCLLGILLTFRQDDAAVVADIEAMFHQFKAPKHDRGALRFLWWREGFEIAPATYQMTRHIFSPTESPSSCTYGLRRCAMDNKGDLDSRFERKRKPSNYASNW